MIAQLSMSRAVSQQELMARRILGLACVVFITLFVVPVTLGSDLNLQIRPLTAIDKRYMADQRKTVEDFANRLGRRLSGAPDRDLDTLQIIADRRWIDPGDIKTQQALGVVFGDLLAAELDFHWVVYSDDTGRSRALQYKQEALFIFPVTMLSRRLTAEAPLAVQELFDEQVTKQRLTLPGAKWMPLQ